MASFKYLVRTVKSKNSSTPKIYVSFSYGRGKQFRTSTGYSLKDVNHWDEGRQKIKTVLDEPNAALHNSRLIDLKSFFMDEYNQLSTGGEAIDNYKCKEIFNAFEQTAASTKKKVSKDFDVLFDTFVTSSENGSRRTRKGTKVAKSTIKTYKDVSNFFIEFQKECGTIRFSNIDLIFYNKLVQYCEDKKLSRNYIGKQVKVLKTFLKYAVKTHDVKLSSKYHAEEFVVLNEDVDEVYLSNEELMHLYHLDLQSRSIEHMRARDLFLIGAYTGLRISDFNRLTKENLYTINGQQFFKVIAKKTNDEVIIPVTEIVHRIIERNNGIPKTMPDQKINELIKDVCEVAGIDETVKITKTIGGKQVLQSNLKCDLVKSHTARRSFCTNAYLGGMDSLMIMAISGHKTEKSFLKYIKVTRQQQAERIAESPYFKSLSPDNFDKEGNTKLKAV
jgi:site-specific recombinase XerD